jgi:hypothetical protein
MKDRLGCRHLDSRSKLFYEERAQVAEAVFLNGEAGRHCMAAAPAQQTGLLSGNDSGTEVRAGNRSAGTGADTVAKSDDTSRVIEPLDEAAGDDTDYSRMPALSRSHQHRNAADRNRLHRDLGERFLENGSLNISPRPVGEVKTAGHVRGFDSVHARKKASTQSGFADPASGVNPWAEHETGMIRSGRGVKAGNSRERLQAMVGPLRHHFQALNNQCPVDALQGDQITKRAQGNEIQPQTQIRLGMVRVKAAGSEGSVDRNHQQERHSDGGKMALPARIIRPVRIDDGGCRWERGLDRVVIDDNHVQSGFGGRLQGFVSRRTAINRDDDGNTLAVQLQ